MKHQRWPVAGLYTYKEKNPHKGAPFPNTSTRARKFELRFWQCRQPEVLCRIFTNAVPEHSSFISIQNKNPLTPLPSFSTGQSFRRSKGLRFKAGAKCLRSKESAGDDLTASIPLERILDREGVDVPAAADEAPAGRDGPEVTLGVVYVEYIRVAIDQQHAFFTT